jgi:alpha-mannosidase
MTKTTVHMIGQAHLDPAWLWRWPEGRAEALATSRSAADRLREYPDFHFVRGEAQIYDWIEREDPALFAEIVARIREGRWHVVNGMIVQPDMNLPQGESFVRHFLLGKAYMREMLGVEPAVAYCVDSFGHAETLPQIFRKCGCEAYVFMRPGPHEMPGVPQAFWWQAPDGSRVLTFRIAGSYGTRTLELSAHIDRALEQKPDGLSDTMCFFGVGNHGGGPTIAQIEALHALQGERDDVEIRFSSPQIYFDAVRATAEGWPTVAEELYFHATGCYSANSGLKRAHRQAECRLLVAERMAALAHAWVGREVEGKTLRQLWVSTCFNQFHDILGGCTVKDAADDAIAALQRVVVTAQEITDDAGRAIASQVNTAVPGGSAVPSGTVVLFNPAAEPVEQYVEYEPWTEWDAWDAGGWGLADERGEPVAWQKITSHEALTSPEGRGIHRLVFRASLPPLGYRVFRFAKGLPQGDLASAVKVTPATLENEHLRIALDPATGDIRSCVDVASGLELVGPAGWNVMQALEDTSDTWSHRETRWEKVVGTFGKPVITVAENGPLQASLLVERSYEDASTLADADGARGTLLQELIVRRDEPELLIRNWLFWQGRWRMLKLACDVAVTEPHAARDVPFGFSVWPADGTERAGQMWVGVSGDATADPAQTAGLALLNDGKYGCDVSGSTVRLTVLRCPPYAYHVPPHVFGTKLRYDWLDQGSQEFTVVLRPHVGDWREAEVVKRARELNLPLPAITMHSHAGKRPKSASLAGLTNADMELTALKLAEDGDGYIVRVADRHGRPSRGALVWGAQSFSLALAPFEVVTLRVRQRGGQWEAVRCDMIERNSGRD